MPSNPTLSWERLGDKFYKNYEGYSMLWDVNIDEYMVASAPFGGALALCRDSSKLTEYKGPDSRQTSIYIYSGPGNLIKKLPWDNGRIRGLGWSELEHLIVVSEHGNARYYYDFDGNFFQFSLGKVAESSGVNNCQFGNTGFVAQLENKRFVSISRYAEPNPRLLAELPEDHGPVHGWTLLPPEVEMGQHFEVIVGVDTSLYQLNLTSARSLGLKEGPFTHLAASPSGEHIALYTKSGRMHLVSSDFQRQLTQFEPKMDEELRGLVWCGDDAVTLVWEEEVRLVSPSGEDLSLLFDGPVVLFPEVDGMRTLTSTSHDFFAKLPNLVVNIFKLGSTSPGAILRDCVDQLDRKSPKADENLTIIGSKLPRAVDACVEAAGYEFEAYWQKKLLKAAAFGKTAIELYNSDKFVEMCDYLRVLNSVRQFDVGMLISYPQLVRLTPSKLIDRLLIRRMHQLAFQCAKYLRMPTEKIYVHWACTKVRVSPHEDEFVCKEIVDKLSKLHGISYEKIARTAYTEGRTKLAVLLTGHEPRSDRQIPLLLDMQEQSLALEAAVKSYNVNLVEYVLRVLYSKLPLAAFFRLINDNQLVTTVFEKRFCADQELLQSFYYQDDRRLQSARLKYNQALNEQHSQNDKLEMLEQAHKLFQELPANAFDARAIEEQSRLLILQEQLERDYDQPFVGQSVSDTVGTLLRMSQNPRALKIKEEFKMPDRRYWWIRLRALTSRRDWDNLYKFAASKKSPIGYEPFYNECISAGSKNQAARYVSMCTDLPYKRRIEMYVEVGEVMAAAKEAHKHKDVPELRHLAEGATSSVKAQIEELINKPK